MKKGPLWAALPVNLLFLCLLFFSTANSTNTPDRLLKNNKIKRTTLLLVTYPDGIDKAPQYADLSKTRLCLEPPDCVPRS